MTSTPPKPPKQIRLTISITPEVHATFVRIAKAGGMSISRAMGEWLDDTIDAAGFMATTMEKARAAPKLVAQELHAYALGLGDETGELLKRMREIGAASGPSPEGRAAAAALPESKPSACPPSSNTGGKVPKKVHKRGGKG